MCRAIEHMLHEVIQRGTPANRVFLGGFSNGGAAALHAGLRTKLPIGGVMCLSGALGMGSSTYEFLASSRSPSPVPVLLCHGKDDHVIPLAAAKATADKLATVGVNVDMEEFGRLRHGLGDGEVRTIAHWLRAHIED